MQDFTKVVRLGTIQHGRRYTSVYCEIIYKEKVLSICGVVGPLPSGNCHGSFGQINMSWQPIVHFAKGWDKGKEVRFLSIWKRWHLNDMRNGTPKQELAVAEYHNRPDLQGKCKYGYVDLDTIYAELEKDGLLYDTLPDGTQYKYGSARLFEAVPEEVLKFLYNLPNADRQPAWV